MARPSPAAPRPSDPESIAPQRHASAPFDLYAVFVAELKRFAVAPRTETEIAAHFGLTAEQGRRWLARAEAEGAVRASAGSYRAA